MDAGHPRNSRTSLKRLLQGSEAPPRDVQQERGTAGDPESSQGSRGRGSPTPNVMEKKPGAPQARPFLLAVASGCISMSDVH